jgi:prepilin-type N-terminal cleavage/methylation domain-containing protein
MSRPRAPYGFTLIELMCAMGIVLIGTVGLIGLQTAGLRINGDARRMTRATAIAQDLLNQIDTWAYTDPRLGNPNTSNDTDVGDTAYAFEDATHADPVLDGLADRGEADLGANWHGIPSSLLADAGYERYWNTSDKDPATPTLILDSNGNNVADGLRVAVIVRWPHQGAWRRIVLMGFKHNPAEMQ